MAQDIVNNNQGISYTNLDFSSIYIEVLDLIKKLTYKWDPSISDESDPGVILVKLSALLADKCNYNIDKSVLEAFPLSVTQEANARQLYEQLGYYMDWYEAATVPVLLSWINESGNTNEEVKEYTIPLFTPISNKDGSIKYTLIGVEGPDGVVVSNGMLTTDSRELKMIAMEGIAVKYSYQNNGSNIVTSQMVDKDTHRIYFTGDSFAQRIVQNGIFITNTGQSNYSSWKRVNNIYEQSYNELRYKFGYDQFSQNCYLEFPDNYSELIGDGIEITYILLEDEERAQDIPAQELEQFISPFVTLEDPNVTLSSSNVKISNYAAASGHKNSESINEAYSNYKKTVGTFKTLITLRDYLNYIKSKDLDICSNAFVCDRTNDVQSTYKVVSKQHGLDSIIVNVEQIVDKTKVTSNFDYTFTVSRDGHSIAGKEYYIIENDTLRAVQDTTGGHPAEAGWYEFTSRAAKKRDALDAFSLKFYMLKNSILLNSSSAFNETFEMSNEKLDIDSILGDTAHLEHKFEDILPLGTNSYKVTSDTHYLENKAYYIQDNEINTFKLYTNYTPGDVINSLTNTVYELDVEALLPHIVFYKNIYPLVVNVSTYDNLNEKTQQEVQKNILTALYNGLNSSELNFGESISTAYLEELVKSSDTHIRSASFDPFTYVTKAIYYKDGQFKSVTLPSSVTDMQIDQKDEDSVLAYFVSKDIVAKSILSGVTSLLTPDDIFTYHLNHKFINYYDNVYSITSQAVIDIGGDDAITTYSYNSSKPYITRSYTLKENEALHLYRPKLENVKEFSSGIHYEYLLYNNIEAGQSYELQNGEYFIFYQSINTENQPYQQPDGYSVHACTKGCIVNPSMEIISQTDVASLSNFAMANVISWFEANPSENIYETNTYASHYVTEIYNSPIIGDNAITGTNTIKFQKIFEVTLNESDNYRFFWVLKTPRYSNENKVKSYTLFPEYDMKVNRLSDKERNSYTLKTGERLYYTDSSNSSLAIYGPGTTIYRNCGITSEYEDDNADTCTEFVNINKFSSTGDDERFRNGKLELIVNQDNGINPKLNGFYEVAPEGSEQVYIRTQDEQLGDKSYYVLVARDNSGLFRRIGDSAPFQHTPTLQSSEVFSEVNPESYMSNINPKEDGLYEIVSTMGHGIQDNYALSSGAMYEDRFRYTETLDDTILTRKIFTHPSFADIDISDVSTYKTITISESTQEEFNYVANKLLVPSDGDKSYKSYFTFDEGTGTYNKVNNISILDNPSDPEKNHIGLPWYELNNDSYTLSTDTRAQISSKVNSLSYPDVITSDYCFEEVPFTQWPSGGVLNYSDNGYFRKYNASTLDYIFPTYIKVSEEETIPDQTYASEVTMELLTYLVKLLAEAENTHGSTSYTSIINYIIDNWDKSACYIHPFKTFDKIGWRIKNFVLSEESQGTHYGFTSEYFKEYIVPRLSSTATIYPRCSINIDYDSYSDLDKVDIIVKKSDVDISTAVGDSSSEQSSSILDGAIELSEASDPYIEIFDRRGDVSDKMLCDYINNLAESFTGLASCYMEYPPNVYKFKDLFRRYDKIYYTPNLYVEKIFDAVSPWSCEALNMDELAKDPISVISDKWQSLQPNTSITIDETEIWDFAEGDVVRFTTEESSSNSVTWPRFSNTEIPLNLDKYSISYQKKGQSIEDLDNLVLNGHSWQGYSQLLLNTSSKEGQKLDYNHSVILYDENNKEIAILNGRDYTNLSLQLKSPVSNVAGRYIDVTTTDMFGNLIPNGIYEFVPLISNNTNYRYGSDNRTYSIFNTELNSNNERHIINSQVRIPVMLPEGKYILPVYTETDNVLYSVNYCITTRTPDSSNLQYCVNMSPEFSGTSTGTIRIHGNENGEHLYGYNKDKSLGFDITNTDYNYLDITNELFNEKIESYESVSRAYLPNFNERDYYEYTDQGEYKLLDSMPEDWESNWWSYFIRNITINYYRKVKLPAYITAEYFDEGLITKSPQDLQWYELDSSGHFVLSFNTDIGEDLLQEVELNLNSYDWVKHTNPSTEGWYERLGVEGSYYYVLTSDTRVNMSKLIEYNHIDYVVAPSFEDGEYFSYDEDTGTYIYLEEKPDDWETNWTNYYIQSYKDKVYFKDKEFYIPTDVLSDPQLRINAENLFTNVNSDIVYIIFDDIYKYNNNPIFTKEVFNDLKEKVGKLDVDDKYNYTFKPDKNSDIEDPLNPLSFFEANHPFNKYVISQLDLDNLSFRFPAIRGRR
jgi:hypothetical protein